MKKPILITGYERSGTTLLRRIVSMHPSLEYDIVHEMGAKLFRSKNRDDAIRKLTFNSKQTGNNTGGVSSLKSGQKIPYIDFRTFKKSIEKFNAFFDKYWIIHIVRDPIGAINSQIKTFNKKFNVCFDGYFSSVAKVIELLSRMDNVLSINFEDIMGSPKENISKIYRWMGDFEDDSYINMVMANKDPWKYNGRVMPGLRYFNSISNQKVNFILSKDQVNKIKRANKWKHL